MFWFLFGALCLGLSLRYVNDADIWFQLLAGRFALENLAVPHREFFLYAGAAAEQLFGGWGFGVLAELAVRAGGWSGLSIFNSLLWSLMLCMGIAAARARLDCQASGSFTASELAAFAITLLVVYQAFLERSDIRAEVTLYLAWMVGAVLFENTTPSRNARALILFPLVCFLLAWLHTTAVLMLPLFAAYALRRWLQRNEAALTSGESLKWVASLTACLILPALTPNGIYQSYSQPLHWLFGSDGETTIPNALFTNLEYLPVWDARSRAFWPVAVVLSLGTLTWAALDMRRRPWDLVTLIPMAYMAMTHRRGLGLWAMALLVPLAAALARALRELDEKKPFTRSLVPAQLGAAAVAVVATCVLVAQSHKWGWGLHREAGIRADEVAKVVARLMPEGGNALMLDQIAPQLPYLLGPKYKVAFAGHLVLPNREATEHYVRVMGTLPGWNAELDKYNVQVVAVPTLILPYPDLVGIANRLASHPGWDLAAVDRQILVFHRRPAGPPPPPAQRWKQLHAYFENALEMAQAANLIAPQPRTAALATGLRKGLQVLEAVRERPQDFNWSKMDVEAGYAK